MTIRASAAKFATLLLATSTTACGWGGDDPLENGPGEEVGGRSSAAARSARGLGAEAIVTSLEDIAGPWDVESFTGYRPTRLGEDGLRRAYVNVGSRGLSYTLECNYSGNPAAIDAEGVLHDTSREPRLTTAMSCGPPIDARDSRFFGFFSTRPTVTRLADGRIRMVSGAGELVLERPDERRLANVPPLREIVGRWVPQMASRVEDGGHSGWGFQEETILAVTGDGLRWSGCGGLTIRFRYSGDGRMAKLGEQGRPACTDNPGSILVQVLRAGPLVERTAGGGIALTAGDLVISLKSLEEIRRLRENPPRPPPGGAPTAAPPPPPPPPPPSQARSGDGA